MDVTLERLQRTQIEILDVIDSVCKINSIDYSLYCGTLLGAVRHKGFIPWDDDLDICMTRENYNRFIDVWERNPIKGYFLQNKDMEPEFTQSFTKIRKDNTCFLHQGENLDKYHTGIFVDIFPIDRIPKGKISRVIFKWRCMKYQLYTREFVPPTGNIVIKIGSKLILLFSPRKTRNQRRDLLLKKITKFNCDTTNELVGIETMENLSYIFPPDMMSEYITLDFAQKQYQCVKDWNCMLKRTYGDYMQLPPENERVWKHHPRIIQFDVTASNCIGDDLPNIKE